MLTRPDAPIGPSHRTPISSNPMTRRAARIANGAQHGPIFVPESLSLAAFAISWLVKGEAHQALER